MATDFATRTELQDLERRMEARLQLVEHIDERFDRVEGRFDRVDERFGRVERQIRGLRNWAAAAFLILLMLEIFMLWRVG